MKLETFSTHLAAPVFFFMAGVLFILSFTFLWMTVTTSSSYFVISCLVFVFAYNALLVALKATKAK